MARKTKTKKKVRKLKPLIKSVYVIWGRTVRKARINIRNYKVAWKVGRYNVYKKISYRGSTIRFKKIAYQKIYKRKPVKRKRPVKKKTTKRKIPAKRREAILKIKGVTLDPRKLREVERKMLSEIRLLPPIKRGQFARIINPNKIIITDQKDYESFKEMEANKRNIYLTIMDRLVTAKNPKFLDRMYELKDKLLRDGLIIEVDLYGKLHKQSNRILYLGRLGITGLMLEELSVLENDIIGSTGYLHELEPIVDTAVKGKGGDGARLIQNNTLNANVTITNVKLRFNYA